MPPTPSPLRRLAAEARAAARAAAGSDDGLRAAGRGRVRRAVRRPRARRARSPTRAALTERARVTPLFSARYPGRPRGSRLLGLEARRGRERRHQRRLRGARDARGPARAAGRAAGRDRHLASVLQAGAAELAGRGRTWRSRHSRSSPQDPLGARGVPAVRARRSPGLSWSEMPAFTSQSPCDVRFEWGERGLRALARGRRACS